MPRTKYDVEFRQQCLIEKKDKEYLSVQYIRMKALRDKMMSCFYDDINFDRIANDMRKVSKQVSEDKTLDCGRLLVRSRYEKRKRIEKHITNLVLSGKALFVTLTFDNDTLEKTTREKRRRLIQRYLKNNCSHYVANIDFGKDKGREHYHAIVENKINLKAYKLGSIDVEHIKASDLSLELTSKYINKLTSHALKQNAIDTRLIFSRKVN